MHSENNSQSLQETLVNHLKIRQKMPRDIKTHKRGRKIPKGQLNS